MTEEKKISYPYPNVIRTAKITASICAVLSLIITIVGILFFGWSWKLIILSIIGSALAGFLAGVFVEYREDKKRGLV